MATLTESNLSATIKARVGLDQKRALDAIARARQLKTPDVVREALRFYLIHMPRQALDPASFFVPEQLVEETK